MSDPNMDTSPESEADTASGGPAEPWGGGEHDTATGSDAPRETNPPDGADTDDDGTPVENPSG